MTTSSSQKFYVTFVAFDEVVIRTLGEVLESQSEKYDVNELESMSVDVSRAMDTPSTGAVPGSLEPSER